MRKLRAAFFAVALLLPAAASAQVDSREGIALQNQILQLRQEMEALRRGGGLPPPMPQGSGSQLGSGARAPAAGAPQAEMVGQLLDRVSRLEEELRTVRGRAEEGEFRERQLRERLEKLEGDMDFRLQRLEGQRQGSVAPTPVPARPATPQAAEAPASPRTPQRALAEGQAALARRDWPAAEAAAREVVASRDAARQVDGHILLGDALLGRRDFAGAAVAYDDALRRNQRGTRSAEAMLGVANALIGLNNMRDACAQLNDLRSRHPNPAAPLVPRIADARRRAQCR